MNNKDDLYIDTPIQSVLVEYYTEVMKQQLFSDNPLLDKLPRKKLSLAQRLRYRLLNFQHELRSNLCKLIMMDKNYGEYYDDY